MCGICGIYRRDGNPVRKSILVGMTKLLAHRGPDGDGHEISGPVGIGHRRLAIIDPRGGAQPMWDSSRRYSITFNGEIYNFAQLRDELRAAGAVFRTNSDTEVILEGFARHGTAFFERLNGMFAFGIVDHTRKTLTLARDRLGIKPLYIFEPTTQTSTSNVNILFASEIKAFYADPDFKPIPNLAAIKEYLTFSNLHHNISFFTDVRQLPPGSWLTFEWKNTTSGTFWSSKYTAAHESHEARITEFRTILDASVSRHLVSDVPVGCYLSGGIDSSGVAVTAHHIRVQKQEKQNRSKTQKHSSLQPLHVFTGTFASSEKYSELPAAQETAQSIGAQHHVATVTPEQFLTSIEAITYALDEPRAGMGAFPQYHVSELVSKHVTVVLTGHGGDELFAGYPLFKARQIKNMLTQPRAALKALLSIKPTEVGHLAYYLFFPIMQKEVGYGTFILFSPKQQHKLFTANFQVRTQQHDPYAYVKSLASNSALSPEARVQEIYLKTYLPSLFIVEDKVGMAHSIEARTPLCDNEMLAFSQSISLADKLHGGHLKSIPRDALRDRLPASLYSQPKKGFPTPLSLWFRDPLKQYLEDTLLSGTMAQRDIISESYVRALIDAHCARSTDGLRDYVETAKLWSILQVELWFRIFIDGAPAIRERSVA